jgi:hypothetical protein
LGFVFTLDEVDARWFKGTGLDAEAATGAMLLIDIDYAVIVSAHSRVLLRAFVVTWMIQTVLARVNLVYH